MGGYIFLLFGGGVPFPNFFDEYFNLDQLRLHQKCNLSRPSGSAMKVKKKFNSKKADGWLTGRLTNNNATYLRMKTKPN